MTTRKGPTFSCCSVLSPQPHALCRQLKHPGPQLKKRACALLQMDAPRSCLTRSWKQNHGNLAKALKGSLQSCSLISACFRKRMQIQDPSEGGFKTGSLKQQPAHNLQCSEQACWGLKDARTQELPRNSTCSLRLTGLEKTNIFSASISGQHQAQAKPLQCWLLHVAGLFCAALENGATSLKTKMPPYSCLETAT